MHIIVDSRERKYDHIINYFDSQEIKWHRSKLICGDYQNPLNPMIIIDRKKDLHEVAGNVTKDHDRFVRELELAKELGYHLIVLVEEPTITSLPNVCSWYNFRKRTNPRAINGKTLYKIMLTMQQKYGVEWQFCKKHECGKRIIEILTEVKNDERSN